MTQDSSWQTVSKYGGDPNNVLEWYSDHGHVSSGWIVHDSSHDLNTRQKSIIQIMAWITDVTGHLSTGQ